MSQLSDAIQNVRAKIQRQGSKSLNEQATKATLIQPVLRALGWDVEDLEDIQLEYRRKPSDKPVDYALMLMRSPCLFVEAKGLGENLDDPKWANQFIGYAMVAGVEWVALTNGDEYRLYNSHSPVPVEEKLFRTIRLSDPSAPADETLRLLSKDCIRENEINVLWKAHFVDRQVRSAVEGLFCCNPEPDAALVRLVRKKFKNLSRSDVRASLQRARVHFDFPVDLSQLVASHIPTTKSKSALKVRKSTKATPKKAYIGVTLKELIDGGFLAAPLKLSKKYRGQVFEAELLRDGTVKFRAEIYSSCSSAADAARHVVIGGTPHTNGWAWWQFTENGKRKTLDDVRQEYLKGRLRVVSASS
jgi:hypothetical protein